MADVTEELFNPTASQSIWKVTRQLKKEQSSLYNCVASVLSDAAFVSEIRSLYPSLPLLANLRCGLWYTRQADGACYFKSTDGHNGNWSFSSTRLNWNVCELAAKHGGVIIVDATRKGKRFPDAMTKTIPIWAAVVNRAVARKRAEAAVRNAAAAAALAAETAAEATAAVKAVGCQLELQPDLAAACGNSGAFSSGPSSLPVAAPPMRGMRRDRRGSGGGAASVTPLQCSRAVWPTVEGDCAGSGNGGCARVGSLSQWLQSPMAAAANEDEVEVGVLCPRTKLRCCLLHDGRGTDGLSAAAATAAPLLLGGGSERTVMGLDSAAGSEQYGVGTEMYGLEDLQEEVSFGELGDMFPDGDPQQTQEPPAADMVCRDHSGAAAPANADDGPCLFGAAQAACHTGAGAAPPAAAAAAHLFLSPFAVVAAAAVAAPAPVPEAHGVTDRLSVVAAAPAVGASESFGSVDLGAASASHVSCSPEEGWRRGGLFCGVVGNADELLRLRCSCDSWDCGEGQQLQQGTADADVGPGSARHRPRRQPQDSDLDLDGSVGSCSDTGGPAGLSCLVSTRTSSSSSSSSRCVSRSSSCSSCDHADRAGPGPGGALSAAGDGAGRGRAAAACPSGESTPRLRPFPRHHTCSPSASPPWSPSRARRCGLPPSQAASGSSSGGDSSCSNGTGSCSSSRGSSSGGAGDAAVSITAAGDACVGSGCACVAGGECWDVGLHLPLWISANERAQIERRLDGWVDALLRVGADVEGLAKVLRKPLRPLWINQSSTIWVDQVAQPDQLPFTPLYLVSASQPHSYLRQAGCCVGGGGSDADADADADSSDAGRRHPHQRHKRSGRGHGQEQQQHAWTYVYVPGAGDDEESWAAGLTPAVFWAHYTELLQAGPAGVHDAVRQVLQREAAALAERGTNSSILAAAATHGSAAAAGVAAAYAAPTDQHHLMPAGCRAATPAAVATTAVAGPGGLFFIGPTGIALGDLAAGTSPACWSQVDAVLCCGPQQHPSMASEPQWPHGGELLPGLEVRQEAGPRQAQGWGRGRGHGGVEAEVGERAAAAVVGRGGGDCGTPLGAWRTRGAKELEAVASSPAGCGEAVEEAGGGGGAVDGFCFQTAARSGDAGGEDSATTADASEGAGSKQQHHIQHQHRKHHCPTAQARPRHHHHHCSAPRYLHLPVQHYKHHRTSLLQHLGPALEFLSYHLSRGRRVLIHDTNGLDTCVCVAVALLLACYGPCGGGSGGGNGGGGDVGAPVWVRSYAAPGSGGAAAAAELAALAISKDAVRQRLAFVSAFYPPARPTRGMLRQVFNHFVSTRGDGSGGDGGLAAGCEEELE